MEGERGTRQSRVVTGLVPRLFQAGSRGVKLKGEPVRGLARSDFIVDLRDEATLSSTEAKPFQD